MKIQILASYLEVLSNPLKKNGQQKIIIRKIISHHSHSLLEPLIISLLQSNPHFLVSLI
jgi:hypothetical protein